MRPNPVRGLESFVDSSWATKFSCSGGMFFYHRCLFHWLSKMQRSATLSSAEAEFFGAMLAAKGGYLHSRGAAHRPRHPCRDAPSVIKCDSKSAVGMAFDPVAFKKTKHILRAAEFLRDLVAREVISVEHLPGAVMLADILTKAAARAVFVELIKQLDAFAWLRARIGPGGAVPGHMHPCTPARNSFIGSGRITHTIAFSLSFLCPV